MPRSAPLIACLLGLLLVAAPAHAVSRPPWGTGESKGEDLIISLVTFSPGDDVASWWGHGSLVVEDQRLGSARLYNYGMFSFDSTMLARYAMGRLEFWVAEASPSGTYRALPGDGPGRAHPGAEPHARAAPGDWPPARGQRAAGEPELPVPALQRQLRHPAPGHDRPGLGGQLQQADSGPGADDAARAHAPLHRRQPADERAARLPDERRDRPAHHPLARRPSSRTSWSGRWPRSR